MNMNKLYYLQCKRFQLVDIMMMMMMMMMIIPFGQVRQAIFSRAVETFFKKRLFNLSSNNWLICLCQNES